ANRPHIFRVFAVRWVDCSGRAVPWAVREAGATRAASIRYGGSENSMVCTKSVADSIDRYADVTGVEVVDTNDNLEYGLPNGFAVRCVDCSGRAVPWAAREAGATRAASIGYGVSENSRVCTNSVADSIDRYADDTGVEVVYTNDNLQYGLPNGIAPEVSAMKDA